MNRKTFLQSVAFTAGYAVVPPMVQATASLSPASDGMAIPLTALADWTGSWLGLDWLTDARSIGSQPILFRRDLELNGTVSSAIVRVSASPGYALWVNGRAVSHGPARSYPAHQFYDELNLLPYLREGANALAVLVNAPTGVSGYGVQSRIGFILDGQVVTASGSIPLETNPITWRTKRADWYDSSLLLASMPTGFQEHVRAQPMDSDWKTAPFDATWAEPFYLGPAQTPPWKTLTLRPVSLLQQTLAKPVLVWRGTADRTLTDWRANLAVRFNQESLVGEAVLETDYDWFDARTGTVLTFDFGKTRLIRAGVETRSVAGNLRIECYYSLELLTRPNAMVGFGSTQEGFVDTVSPPEGDAGWEAVTARGFRFLTIKLTGNGSGQFRLTPITIDYPFPDKAALTSPDSFLQQTWRVSAESLRSSANDVYVDTCSRENMAWSLDSCHQGKAGFYTFGETTLWRRSLLLVMQGIDDDGIPHAINPTERTFMVLFDQTMQCVTACRDYYMATGEIVFVQEIMPAVLRFARLCEQHITTENLFVPPAYSWHWVDWSAIDREPYSLPINCLLLQMTEAAMQLAAVVNNKGLIAVAARISTRIRPALIRFYDPVHGRFLARITPKISNIAVNRFLAHPNPVASNLHGNMLACTLSIGTSVQRRAAMAFAVSCLKPTITTQNQFGPGWTDTLLSPLISAGYAEPVIKFLDVFYGAHLRAGAPTWGEGYLGESEPDKLRFNTAHGWGATVNILIAEQLVGLKPLKPGWKQIDLNPRWSAVDEVAYTLQTPVGPVSVSIRNGAVSAQIPKHISYRFRGQSLVGTGTMDKLR